MAIKVKIFGTLRLKSGIKEVELSSGGSTKRLGQILEELGQQRGLEDLKRLGSLNLSRGIPFIIMVDGKNCMQLRGLDTLIQDGQVVAIFPPSAGG